MYQVYKIECKPIGKCYYGRSQELEKRWRAHKNMLRTDNHHNLHMQLDWNEYGEESFEFSVVGSYETLDDSVEAEQEFIDSNRGSGYNISNSINGGDTFTFHPRKEEIRELRRQMASGENNPMYGKPKNDYTLARIKEANSKPISIEGVIYPSISQASKELKVNGTTISYRLNAKSESFKEWVYVSK